MNAAPLSALRAARDRGQALGIVSVCSAHPLVIEATLRHALARGTDALIEATCNQVNQDGGYTGMAPRDFLNQVVGIAGQVGFDAGRLILGGDHLGPNPWRHLPADAAMGHAQAMIAAYVRAGFTKIHLDASMGCLGESAAMPDEIAAERAARLARVAEDTAEGCGRAPPFYVIGTEVPVPGGAHGELAPVAITPPAAAVATVEANRAAFARHGIARAFHRVVGVVVQPGVEFGDEHVAIYDSDAARGLSAALDVLHGLVYEAHSTDYQPREALSALVTDGFAILKVGPAATFALREALYGLEAVAGELDGASTADGLRSVLERVMLQDPRHWQAHYDGDGRAQRLQRHFSFSDRIRYYWPNTDVADAVARLMGRLTDRPIPAALIRQYLGTLYPDLASGRIRAVPRDLLLGSISRVLDDYAAACGGGGGFSGDPAPNTR